MPLLHDDVELTHPQVQVKALTGRVCPYWPRAHKKVIANLELQIAKISALWALPVHTYGLRSKPVGLWL